MFDIVELWVHDGTMQVDDRPRLRRTSHALALTYLLPVIASPRLRTSDNGNRSRWQHRPLKDNRHENIKWDPWMKDSPEKQQA